MGKKYIIEIPEDKIADFVGSTHFLMPYMMAGHIGHHDTGLPIEPYTEPDLERVRKEAYEDGYKTAKVQCNIQAEKDLREVGKRHYQKGLSDAWEAARKISMSKIDGGFSWESMIDIFGTIDTGKIYKTFTASEAIEKIRQYEQKQKQEEKQLQVGDEVSAPFGTAVVTRITDDKIWFCYTDGHSGFEYKKDAPRKTGRHFPEIAEVLQKMKETQ